MVGRLDPPGPVAIAFVDLDDATSAQLERFAGNRETWVVGCRDGVPQAVVEIDPAADSVGSEQRLQELRAIPLQPQVAGAAGVPDDQLPSISVVVPSVVARLDELRRCLDSLDAVDYPDVEVVVVDNRREVPSDDPLPGLVASRPRLRTEREPRPGISAARNRGWRSARGQVVVFTDDDVVVDPGWLRAIGSRFVVQPELDAVTGLILPAELSTPAQVWFERYYGGFSGERTFQPLTLHPGSGRLGRARVSVRDVAGREVRTFAVYGVGAYGAGANMAFRRTVLERLDEFDLTLGTGTPARGGEDLAALIDVLWAGGCLGYEPAAVVHHTHRRGYDELLRQLRGNGLGFTAMITALSLRRTGHVLGLSAQLPLAARRLAAQSLSRVAGRRAGDAAGEPHAGPAYPKRLVVEEVWGMLQGPGAYRRSLRQAKALAPVAGSRRPDRG